MFLTGISTGEASHHGQVIVRQGNGRNYEGTDASGGRAFVYHGSPSGLSPTPAWIFDSPWLWLAGNGSTEGDVRIGGSPSGLEDGPSRLDDLTLLGESTPNPFIGWTAISFALPRDGIVHLGIFDLQGRLRARLVEGSQPAGPQEVRWDGKDAHGTPLPAGVYFARQEYEGQVEVRKLVLARGKRLHRRDLSKETHSPSASPNSVLRIRSRSTPEVPRC